MTHNPRTDDEIIAEERRRYRRRVRELMVPLLALVGLVLLLLAADHFRLLTQLGISHGFVAAVLDFFPFALVAVIVIALVRNRPSKDAHSERILRRQIDTYSARWRWLTIMILILLPVMAHNLTARAALLRDHVSWDRLFQPLSFLFVALTFSGVVSFGYGFARKSYREALSDELARALRARTVRIGYLSLMGMLSAAYLAVLYRLAPATTVLPAVLAAGVAVPMIYHLVLDWRAGRGDG